MSLLCPPVLINITNSYIQKKKKTLLNNMEDSMWGKRKCIGTTQRLLHVKDVPERAVVCTASPKYLTVGSVFPQRID